MAIKKTELYSSLWASCDELRGGMDASQYKDYVLTLLFIKYISDKAKNNPRGAMVEVPAGASFDDMVQLKGTKDIGERINTMIQRIAEHNDLRGVMDVADFNDEDKLGKGKEMVDRLSKLVGIFEKLDMASNQATDDDLLGDAYEYLMRHFATESGKSKGQFYTPSEVSRILAKVIGITANTPRDATVYDPSCGSGSLLLKASDEAPQGLTIYGQEMDNATQALARMNMILHDNATANIVQGNTLSSPAFTITDNILKMFDFVVANPPFSNKNWTSGLVPEHDIYDRFHLGVPPEKNGDYAFLLHVLESLKSTGQGAVILPHGVLFRGNAEARIRENLIKRGYIKGIIGLPANLFYGTGIPACIIVLDKGGQLSADFDDQQQVTQGRAIFMLDASQGYMKDGNKNRLRSRDVHKIVDAFNNGSELPGYSRLVPLQEIVDNDYNLNLPRYIDSSAAEDLHDLTAHLQGGIPNSDLDALQDYWTAFPSMRNSLFSPVRPGYSQALVEPQNIRSHILQHPEFIAFTQQAMQPFAQWARYVDLKTLVDDESPKQFIHRISESLLESYADLPLLSKYAMYQILMNYWAEVLQDDIYVLKQDGWMAGARLREILPVKDKNNKNTWPEPHEFILNKCRYKGELIPNSLLIDRFYPEDKQQLEALQAELDAATQQLEEWIESESGEEGLLLDACTNDDKINQKSVNARLKLVLDEDEHKALKQTIKLMKIEGTAKKKHKDAREALDAKVFSRYPQLSEEEIKSLLVDDKWLARLQAGIYTEIEHITQQLAGRLKELEERYAERLPQLTESVRELDAKVAEHLKAMGLEW